MEKLHNSSFKLLRQNRSPSVTTGLLSSSRHPCASVLCFATLPHQLSCCTSTTQTGEGNEFLAAKKSDYTVSIIGTPLRANSQWFPGKQHAEELEPALGLPVMRYNISLSSMEPWCYKSVSDHQKGVHATKHRLNVHTHYQQKNSVYLNTHHFHVFDHHRGTRFNLISNKQPKVTDSNGGSHTGYGFTVKN